MFSTRAQPNGDSQVRQLAPVLSLLAHADQTRDVDARREQLQVLHQLGRLVLGVPAPRAGFSVQGEFRESVFKVGSENGVRVLQWFGTRAAVGASVVAVSSTLKRALAQQRASAAGARVNAFGFISNVQDAELCEDAHVCALQANAVLQQLDELTKVAPSLIVLGGLCRGGHNTQVNMSTHGHR